MFKNKVVQLKRNEDKCKAITLSTLNGDLNLEEFTLIGYGKHPFRNEKTFKKGEPGRFMLTAK